MLLQNYTKNLFLVKPHVRRQNMLQSKFLIDQRNIYIIRSKIYLYKVRNPFN